MVYNNGWTNFQEIGVGVDCPTQATMTKAAISANVSVETTEARYGAVQTGLNSIGWVNSWVMKRRKFVTRKERDCDIYASRTIHTQGQHRSER